jgi:hypothetical protein
MQYSVLRNQASVRYTCDELVHTQLDRASFDVVTVLSLERAQQTSKCSSVKPSAKWLNAKGQGSCVSHIIHVLVTAAAASDGLIQLPYQYHQAACKHATPHRK